MNEIDLDRRRLIGGVAGGAALSVLGGCAAPAVTGTRRGAARVVVIGAGYGGATAAKYLKLWGGDRVEVTLVEREQRFVSCPLSNLVLSGSRRIEELTLPYDGLRARGVTLVQDTATGIDPGRRVVTLARGSERPFDRVIVAPGVDILSDQIQGLTEEAQRTVLHAWKAGPQTVALRAQLEAMPDGGVYVLTIPRAPYRCPPGPYERVCQVAHYFRTAKPRSKVIVLDANEQIVSKKALFERAFNERYRGIVEYRPDSNVTEIDAANRVAITEVGDRVRADVLNVVPPQRAAQIARRAGLVNANDRWCTVDWVTLQSTAVRDVHVLGDATLAAPLMPKSGHMANQHGKAAAAAIVEMVAGRTPQPQMMANTCYSFIDPREVVHIASVHRWVPDKGTMEAVPGSGGLSAEPSVEEGDYANAWARNIWSDMFS